MNYIATELDPYDNEILVEKYIVCGSFEDPLQCYGFDPTQYQGITGFEIEVSFLFVVQVSFWTSRNIQIKCRSLIMVVIWSILRTNPLSSPAVTLLLLKPLLP